MFHIYNYIIFRLIKIIVIIINYKKKALYFKLITNLSLGKYVYSYDGLKIYLPKNIRDVTFRYVVSGFYVNDYANKIETTEKNFYFIDIGSNIGYYTLKASINNNCKQTISIEPNYKIIKYLKKNLKINSKTKYSIYNYAISKNNGKSKFFVNEVDSGSSSLKNYNKNSFKRIYVSNKNYTFFNKLSSKILKNEIKIFVKIDTEGFDIQVLDELKRSILFNKIFNIYIETLNTKKNINNLKKKLKNFSLIKKNPIIDNLKDNRLVDLEFEKKLNF